MDIIKHVAEKMKGSLPGEEAQYEMAPHGRREFADSVKEYTEAAVLSLIYPRNGEWHMVFIQRTSHDKDKHSAQIAFPGGRVEPEDENMIAAALREAEEEIGLDPETVSVLGELTPLKIPVSGFEVFPVLAYTNSEPFFKPQVTEVERIIEVQLIDVVNPMNRQKQEIQLSAGLVLKDVPIFNFSGNIIWGATSMILSEVIATLT